MKDEEIGRRLRSHIRNKIIRENRLRSPLCYDAERTLGIIVEQELENRELYREYSEVDRGGRWLYE